MFQAGHIIYFNKFLFKNGKPSKPKYFIILANIDDKILVASLPTRKNQAPSLVTQTHGCLDSAERCFSCYVFEQGKPIGEQGFSFELTTFIYGEQVEDYEVEKMESEYIRGIDYEILDILKTEEYKAILRCLQDSRSVKRKIKRYLSGSKL